ncbi:hypothetical protein ACN6MT_18420 [Neobacillus niacini]|uniref:hypothetical protein n=1 Tax=Neobacillus niacini TaxID=86668 RepID=UPI003B021F8B
MGHAAVRAARDLVEVEVPKAHVVLMGLDVKEAQKVQRGLKVEEVNIVLVEVEVL